MSGSVAEALLASGSKKLPLLPPPPKIKKDPQTFAFNLELEESNEQTYPEFSWAELVKNAKQKEFTKKIESGAPTLNPYASDDEDDLKAMAAKFEAKYNTVGATKKKKRRAEDYIDRGAGYDESDPFIDNSDVYDEVVPADLQTVHGGFYINSGSLDFKEVELSEDDDDSLPQTPKVPKVKKVKAKLTHPAGSGVLGVLPKQKNPVGRPPGAVNKRRISGDKVVLAKKRKVIYPTVGPDGKYSSTVKKINETTKPENTSGKLEAPKNKVANVSSSSGSSSSSSSEDSSSSSDSDSSSAEETEGKKETPKVKTAAPVKVKANTITPVQTKPVNNLIRQPDMMSTVVQAPAQQKRLKTKNVPLNPKLHPNLSITSSIASSVASVTTTTTSINMSSPQQMQAKVLNKDLIKTNGGSNVNISPRTQSPSGIMPIPTSSPSLKIPPPKPVSTPMVSPGVTISAVTSQASKSSSNVPSKQKIKNKAVSSSINVTPSQLDIFNSIASGYSLANLSNFAPNLTQNSSLLKGGLGIVGSGTPKAMPNLKKMAQSSSAEKLVQKQAKAAAQKPVKSKPKQTNNTPVTPPTSHTSAFNNSGSPSSYLSSLASYKTPPPLAGPGVEISKVRASSSINSSSKTPSSSTSFSSGALGLATVSLAHTSNNNSLTSSSMLSAGITSILNSSPSSLVSNVPSSLTVQRLPQSITITPTSQQNIYPIASSNKSLNTETKATKHISAYDVSALLQTPVVTYTSNILSMGGNSKSGAGKSTNSFGSNRDMQRK